MYLFFFLNQLMNFQSICLFTSLCFLTCQKSREKYWANFTRSARDHRAKERILITVVTTVIISITHVATDNANIGGRTFHLVWGAGPWGWNERIMPSYLSHVSSFVSCNSQYRTENIIHYLQLCSGDIKQMNLKTFLRVDIIVETSSLKWAKSLHYIKVV